MKISMEDIKNITQILNEIQDINDYTDNEIREIFKKYPSLTSILDNIFKSHDKDKIITTDILNNIYSMNLDKVVKRIFTAYFTYKNYQILTELEPNIEEDTNTSSQYYTESSKQYFSEICNIPLLNADQEKELGTKIKNGDNEARTLLIKHNLRLAYSEAKKYVGRGMPLEDLVQYANIGLMKAVDVFDPKRGTRFSTCAVPWIRQSINKAIADENRTIRIPVYLYNMQQQVKFLMNDYYIKTGEEMTVEMIVEKTGFDLYVVERIIENLQPIVSIDKQVDDENDNEIGDVLPSKVDSVENQVIKKMLKKEILELLSDFSEQEKDIIIRRFGLDDHDIQTLDEIGKIYHVSRERIRQIEEKTLRKLRNPKRNRKIVDYI